MSDNRENLSYADLLMLGEERLEEAGISEYKSDAYLLLEHVSRLDRSSFLLEKNNQPSQDIVDQYMSLVEERSTRRPLQHILGTACFYGLDFYVNEHVLVPRFDTENLVEQTLAVIDLMKKDNRQNISLLDMCTGSGCIACTIQDNARDISVYASDLSSDALEVANKNASNIARIHEWSQDITFFQSDVFDDIDETNEFDIIVSNPPYIDIADIDSLEVEVRNYDPHLALFAEDEGLFFYKKITSQANKYLKNGGYLLYEIGYNQGEAVKDIMLKCGFKEVEVMKDLSGLNRVVMGHL